MAFSLFWSITNILSTKGLLEGTHINPKNISYYERLKIIRLNFQKIELFDWAKNSLGKKMGFTRTLSMSFDRAHQKLYIFFSVLGPWELLVQ